MEATALELWRYYIEDWGGDPFIEDDYGRVYCFFCIKRQDEGHSKDCVFIRAKELVQKAKESGLI